MRLRRRSKRGQDLVEVAILAGIMLVGMMVFTLAVPRALQSYYAGHRDMLSGPF